MSFEKVIYARLGRCSFIHKLVCSTGNIRDASSYNRYCPVVKRILSHEPLGNQLIAEICRYVRIVEIGGKNHWEKLMEQSGTIGREYDG